MPPNNKNDDLKTDNMNFDELMNEMSGAEFEPQNNKND